MCIVLFLRLPFYRVFLGSAEAVSVPTRDYGWLLT